MDIGEHVSPLLDFLSFSTSAFYTTRPLDGNGKRALRSPQPDQVASKSAQIVRKNLENL